MYINVPTKIKFLTNDCSKLLVKLVSKKALLCRKWPQGRPCSPDPLRTLLSIGIACLNYMNFLDFSTNPTGLCQTLKHLFNICILQFPKCVRCGTIGKSLISAHLWMSSGGTSSLIHSHDNHLLYCVLFGRRDFILIERSHKKYLDFVEDVRNIFSHTLNICVYFLARIKNYLYFCTPKILFVVLVKKYS